MGPEPIPTELFYLGLSILLGLATILAYGLVADLTHGLRYGAGPRDDPPPDNSPLRGRMGRAVSNFTETFALFAAGVLGVIVFDRTGTGTALGAALYFWGRVAYVPLYAFGVPWLRSVAWFVSILGIILVTMPLLGWSPLD